MCGVVVLLCCCVTDTLVCGIEGEGVAVVRRSDGRKEEWSIVFERDEVR